MMSYTVEWAMIPHFYYEFYVYQYATSVSGAAWFSEQFLAGDDKPCGTTSSAC
jgi:oligoendopeptidase F